jgi:hypothetical protein
MIGWLWRIPVTAEPRAGAIAFAGADEAPVLESMLAGDEVSGAVLLSARPGPDVGILPGRSTASGTADFGDSGSISGSFALLHGPGEPVAKSRLGAHALRDDRVLTIGYDPVASWGTLQGAWALPALRAFIAELTGAPPATLPPLGVVRFDDVPGTAAQQLGGGVKGDDRVRRRLERQIGAYRDADAKLNFAVTCRALKDDALVPADQVWPKAIETLAAGIAEGSVEQVCHGYSHIDEERSSDGLVEPREFARLARAEAARRIAAALEWGESALGRRPASFVAPNWAYSEGTLAELNAIGLPAWRQPRLGALTSGNVIHETLVSTLDGISGVDFRPLGALAEAGVPPTVTIHGGLIDGRRADLRLPRDTALLTKLMARRDLSRIASADGVRWVGASEFVEALRAHRAGRTGTASTVQAG